MKSPESKYCNNFLSKTVLNVTFDRSLHDNKVVLGVKKKHKNQNHVKPNDLYSDLKILIYKQ